MNLYAGRTAGLAFIPVHTGYVVDGGQRQEHITGSLARELFPALLPLLDGTRTVEQIAGILNLPVAYMQRVVALLTQRDLVRLQATSMCEHPSPPVKTFLYRSYPVPWAEGIWHRLQTSNVAVECGQPLTDLLVELFKNSGVGVVNGWAGTPDLTIAVTSAPDLPEPMSHVLPIHVAPATASIGPLIQPGKADECGTSITECDPVLAGTAAGVIAGVALRVLGGHGGHAEDETVIEMLDSGGLMRVVRQSAQGRVDQSEPCRHPARHYLTECRLPLRHSTQPLVRAMSRILGDLHNAPAAGHAGAVRAYLLGDLHDGHRTYFVDPIAGDLVELPASVRHACDAATLVLTHDVCAEQRLLPGDIGLILAQLAHDAIAIGWRVRARPIDACEQLDLDADREQPAAVAELTPVRPRARPAKRARPSAGNRFGDEPLDGARLTKMIVGALTRVEETWAGGRLSCAIYARRVSGIPYGSTQWIGEPDQPCDLESSVLEGYLRDRGLAPAALLLFVADTAEDRQRTKAAMAAATVRLMVSDAGVGVVLLARLPARLPAGQASDRRVLYGCALGSPSTELHSPVPSPVMW